MMKAGSTKSYYSRNQQFSITALTDDSGQLVERYAYDAYGNTITMSPVGGMLANSSVDNPFAYTGRFLHNDLDLMYFRARYYDPSTGEFISRDPLEYVDGMSLYRGYFAPGGTDPTGKVKLRCSCRCGNGRRRWKESIVTDCDSGSANGCCRSACRGKSSRPRPGSGRKVCYFDDGNWEVDGSIPGDDGSGPACPDNWWEGVDYFTCFSCCLQDKQHWILIGCGLESPLTLRPKPKGIALDPRIPNESLGTRLGKACERNGLKVRPGRICGVSHCNCLKLGRGLGHPIWGPIIGGGTGAWSAIGYCSTVCSF
jgi:RHS repeat-associated protein